MDTILTICGIIGGIAGIYGVAAYFKDHVKKPSDHKLTLAAQFKVNQNLALEIRESLIQYSLKHDALNYDLFKGVTFGAYISLLTKTLDNDLNDKALSRLLETELPDGAFESMASSLNTQFTNLSSVKNHFHLYLHSS